MGLFIKSKWIFNEEKLKKKRSDLGLTQANVSKKIGIHVSVYQFWERGVYSPNSNNLFKLCELFSCDESEFYDEVEDCGNEKKELSFNSKKLVEIRNSSKETQQELADFLGVHPSSIRKWENGLRQPNKDNLDLLAKHFACDVEDFMEK